MKLLEIKNNLIKLSFEKSENPILGRFMVLTSPEKSYVAQFVNLKSEVAGNCAIARLLFTFSSEGIVDNYDGSVPSKDSELAFLNPKELLDLLPVETPIKFGTLAQHEQVVNLDISIFENNFTAFIERDLDKSVFISNCVRQLFQLKEKSVIIDTDDLFADYPLIEFSKDFKLPLNAEMIDFLFEYELSGVDSSTKAVIQDIFYAIQQYIKTLEYEFLPIDKFVDVVAAQYKETQMPELALLKNRLLKYRDANIFANTKEEFLALNEIVNEKNCSIISIKNVSDALQKEVVSFIHKALETIEKYVYLFVSFNDDNSDKQLLKQVLNNNHVFTTLLVHNDYKYAKDLKSCAENIVIFTPQTMQHDFAAYNTFLNKLNLGEAILYGKLTQGIPFIIDIMDLELDLTKDDVLGDKYRFIPVPDTMELMPAESVEAADNFENSNSSLVAESDNLISTQDFPEVQSLDVKNAIQATQMQQVEISEMTPVVAENSEEVFDSSAFAEDNSSNIVAPVSNIFDEPEEDTPVISEAPEAEEVSNVPEQDNFAQEEDLLQEDLPLDMEEDLTVDDLDFIEDNQALTENLFAGADDTAQDEIVEAPQSDEFEDYADAQYEEEQSQVVPVYPVEDSSVGVEDGDCPFAQGDSVSHPRYGRGVVEKIIKYGNKTLCSISFENVGRRLLDPSISEFTKL